MYTHMYTHICIYIYVEIHCFFLLLLLLLLLLFFPPLIFYTVMLAPLDKSQEHAKQFGFVFYDFHTVVFLNC